MPSYYVQKFTYDGGDSICYGAYTTHNHAISVQFTVDITNYLNGLRLQNVTAGPFQSGQNKPHQGKEFELINNVWVKA